MFGFLSSPERQLAAARRVLTQIGESSDMPISVRLWDGSLIPLGSGAEKTGVAVVIRSPGVISALVKWPTLDHIIRQYATGGIDLECSDLITFGETIRAAQRRPKLKHLNKAMLASSVIPFLFGRSEGGDVEKGYSGDCQPVDGEARKDKDYIQFHYDLGNDFYRLFLDSEMVYSCGYFTQPNNSLDQAQFDKLDMICRKLRLAPGESFLDIGCGWGGLICHAAKHFGVKAHGVTLAQTQFDHVQEKIRRLGLQGQVTVELKDYRDLQGSYDKIASIGMFEHVGLANLQAYFDKLYSLLRDRGILLNHGIARPAKAPGKRRKRPEQKLIAKYIFPGGELDNIGHTVETMQMTKLEVHDVENWREHYMMTTAHWCRRLTENREAAIKLVGAERYRLWVAYLAGVSFGFHDGVIEIFQVVASKRAKRGRSELPMTRADLYAEPARQALRKSA